MSITHEAPEVNRNMDESKDPMEPYYGKRASVVADALFGEDWSKPGEFYSLVEMDIPFLIKCRGKGIRDINLFTNEFGGLRGLSGIVVSKEDAESQI